MVDYYFFRMNERIIFESARKSFESL